MLNDKWVQQFPIFDMKYLRYFYTQLNMKLGNRGRGLIFGGSLPRELPYIFINIFNTVITNVGLIFLNPK